MPRPVHVFLDLNHWIYLARDYYGTSQHKGHIGVASALLMRVKNDRVRLPLSMMHFIEHLKNDNSERRQRLAEVFELYSRACCFASWSDIAEFELHQALEQVFN